jgi:hypothetical protein
LAASRDDGDMLLFDDLGELLPDGRAVPPEPTYRVAAA